MTENKLCDIEASLCRMLGSGIKNIYQFKHGKNNKVYYLELEDGSEYVAKQYFHHSLDKRDRLHAEFLSLEFLHDNGIKNVPKPIMADYENNIGIYEYIHGEHIADVKEEDINEACNFLVKLYELREKKESEKIQRASASCFSIAEITGIIDNRLNKLLGTGEINENYRKLHDYLNLEFLSNIMKF